MMDHGSVEGGLAKTARSGVLWSMVQNWGGKILAFGLSILLARLLTPEEFGIASAATLVLMLIPMIAEFGFGDAILQRRNLKPEDINLPFYLSVGLITLAVALVAAFSAEISAQIGRPELAVYISVIAGTTVINALCQFQEAVYRRKLSFRILAMRTLNANLVGGAAAVACAWAGFGIWSFVVQAYIASLISLVWLWWQPQWRPGTVLDLRALRQMLRFGIPIVGQRLVDFAGTRFIDIVIIGQYGLAAYGVYIVGAKLYLTMMELLQGALYGVSLTLLSTIAADRERVAGVYIKTASLSSAFISPVFVLLAVLSPEICRVLFGEKWQGVDKVAMALLLLGAVQSVQYMNGAFMAARGRPEITLIAGMVKTVAPILGLLLIPAADLGQLVVIFAIGQLMATPVSFFFASRELGIAPLAILKILAPAAINGILCFAAVVMARPYVEPLGLHAFWQGTLLGAVYAATWLVLIFILDRARFRAALAMVRTRLKPRIAT